MSSLGQDLENCLELSLRIRSGYQPTDEDIQLIKRTFEVLAPLVQAGIEAFNNAVVAIVSRFADAYNQLPIEVRQAYEQGVEREKSKAHHPAGKGIGDVNAELRQSLQVTHLPAPPLPKPERWLEQNYNS